jgi:hypothetical protein
MCGWCGAVSTEPGHFMNASWVVECKGSDEKEVQCYNYGELDGRCDNAGMEVPPDYGLWSVELSSPSTYP